MRTPERIMLAGYSPAGSTHSLALDEIAASLRRDLGAGVAIEIEYNCLDRGRQVQALVEDVAAGELTACYLSTSYLAERVPEIGIVDLPYVFESLEHAHRCLDGELGRIVAERVLSAMGVVVLGYWDNGVRHLSNRVRPVRSVDDCAGLSIRLQPNWAHERFFRELGAVPVLTDLREGIELVVGGGVDAQENPLANFVAYGIERVHPFLTLTGHAFGARGVFAGAGELARWPAEARQALERAVAGAVRAQRRAAEAKEQELRSSLGSSGTRIVELGPVELDRFEAAAGPVLAEARARLGDDLFALVER